MRARRARCQGDEVYIVGAANSAGQAALNLSRFAKRVVLVVRAATLQDTMSRYLVDRIASTRQYRGAYWQQVVAARGDGHLEAVTIVDPAAGDRGVPANWLFAFIGASPRTDWVGAEVVRDEKGFVVTGQDLLPALHKRNAPRWPLDRPPFVLETSVPACIRCR